MKEWGAALEEVPGGAVWVAAHALFPWVAVRVDRGDVGQDTPTGFAL